MRVLLFGATGNIGSRVTERLLARGERPAVYARSAKKARALFGDRVDLFRGDLARPGRSLATALAGIEEVFLVTDGPGLDGYDRAVAAAARAAGVRHVVKLSTLDVHTGVGTGPWHARGEAAVRESGVAYTFLQSAGFMTNALGWADAIRRRGVLRTSTGQGKIAFVHPDDLAEVAVAALSSRDHDNSSLVLTGPEALRYDEMASIVGEVVGKRVRHEELTDKQAHASVVRWAGKGPYADALVDIWRAVREGRLATVTDEVRRILAREPLTFRQWATENAEAFQ